MNAARSGASILGSTLYLYSSGILEFYPRDQKEEAEKLYIPCIRCKRIILNSRIEKIVSTNGKETVVLTKEDVSDALKKRKNL
ncbi:MAG: hypothetical protein QXP53_02290 [Candidatus Pacearchaeota archaeon]